MATSYPGLGAEQAGDPPGAFGCERPSCRAASTFSGDRMPHFRITGAILTAAGVLVGCKSDRPSPQADASAPPVESPRNTPNTVNVTAKDFGFEAPAKVPAGAIRFELANQGKEFHQAQLIRLEDGKTLQDLGKAMSTPGPTPTWVKFVGGVNGIAPGGKANATATLAPGQYAYLCFIPSTDGVMHVTKGMIRPFEVTPATSPAAEAPAADITI